MPPSPLPDARRLVRHDVTSRVLRMARTLGLSFLLLVDTAFGVQSHDARAAYAAGRPWSSSGGQLSGVAVLLSLMGIALAVAVVWRSRQPVWLAIGGTAGAVAGLGPTAALIGLMSTARLRPRDVAIRVGVPVALVTGFRVWVDLTGQPASEHFWPTFFPGLGGEGAWYETVLITALLLAMFAGTGLWLRTRADLTAATRAVRTEQAHVTTLTDQVSRQAERERLAREIHDGLGHNLSILSVHAGALQAMAAAKGKERDDPSTAQMKESAHVVQETAARSVAELHDLLDLLRRPDDPDIAAPTKTLRDVRALVDESVEAGMPLIATVFVDDSEACDPHIAQAVYRTVQELLTNARKHAPGVPVRLTVTGGPADGAVVVASANHLPTASAPPPGNPEARAGTGLSGIRERAERWGGDVAAGLDPSGVWRVSVRLPWAPRSAT